MTTTYSTSPPGTVTAEPQPRPGLFRRRFPALLTGILLVIFIGWCVWEASAPADSAALRLSPQGVLTLAVFAAAIWMWVFSSVGDTYVSLVAAVVLVVMGMLPDETLFSSLGEDTVWLLLAAFVIASGITNTGLSTRLAVFIVTGASTVRSLAHLVTMVLVVTAFAVPSTSGRAALTLPIFVSLAKVLQNRTRAVLALSLLFPTVILLSAVASYLGAGAHLITSQILAASGYDNFSFATWLIYGLPLAFVSSHIATELILRLFTRRQDRRERFSITARDMEQYSSVPLRGPLTVAQSRAALLVVGVVVLWCTEPLHGMHPALVALLGALLVSSPHFGSVGMGKALKSVPWSLLIFMAATLALGAALVGSGAAPWLAHRILGSVSQLGAASGVVFVVAIVVLSTGAHLIIQSRSARSAVLIPLVISLAPAVGVDPVAAAFASTAAAGFCHTLTSSAKPVTLFSDVEDIDTYQPKHLLRLSAILAPLMVALVLLFSFFVWPLMGLPLFIQ